MKKKDLLLPVLSTLLLSPVILAQQVQADEVQTADTSSTIVQQTETTGTSASVSNSALNTPETGSSGSTTDGATADAVAIEASTPTETTASSTATDSIEAVIIHTNDVHGRILEEKGVIGDAKAAAVIEEERSKIENTIVVDAGDAFQGLPISNSTKGEDRANIMNQVGYDAMAVGNHEFDFGMDQAIKYKETLNFPLLSANTYVNGARVFEASTIVDKTPTVVGDEFVVIGITTPETATKTHPKNIEGVTFADPITEVNKVIDEVEARALADNRVYNNYIILAHLGVDATTPVEWRGSTLAEALSQNSKLAGKRVIVIDGHSHTVQSATYGDNVTYNQTGSYLNNIGKVTLKSEQLLGEASLISAADTASVTPDALITELVNEIKVKYEAENAQVVIENNPIELNGERSNVRVRETNLGNAVTDAIYAYGQTGFSNKTSLAVTNGGGLRATIAKNQPVTKGDIIAVLPFGNIISQITVTGQQIQDMFTKSLSSALQTDKETGKFILDENGAPLFEASGGFLQISGATVFYDPTLPVKERVLLIGILNPETGEYDDLDLEKTYYLATNDFLAAGGDGYTMLGGAREEGPSMDSVFADYLKTADLSAYADINPYSRIIPVDSTLDTDEDGYPDFIEVIVGTDPENAASNPDSTSTESPNQGSNGSTSDNKAPVDTPKEKDGKSETVKGNEILKKAPLANGTTPVAKSGVLPNTGDQSSLGLSLFGLGLAGLAMALRRKEEM
ncbi:TPA: cell surface ecto-5'-nucleotidase Nt5e [Streptococcus suis]|nr:5'-nucleotidase C-terminal domain-containing protein [Streptococcus suis]HEM3665103.1 5'-nucleotidase C-terminal domain-containing protein [Streptococcus suis]HEM3679298.1 5'-nucleotidase C-terminal domain-containing protein [Streptococcus suis]HEM3687366.1 5'-nucleotidase C-terminal domain-containing protein [Streptococcus suis]HEM3706378.1 5'-nucleotidase C-terminal domain-containing protein [Streptococcus suis]